MSKKEDTKSPSEKKNSESPPNEEDSEKKSVLKEGGWPLIVLVFSLLLGGTLLDSIVFFINPSSELSGRYLLISIMSSIFPISAFAYQIFQREKQLGRLQVDIEILIGLNKDKAKEYLDEKSAYSHSPWNFLLQSILPTLLTMLGASLLLFPSKSIPFLASDALLTQALRYGFLGAYIFSIQLIYRRYTTLDLQPAIYMDCTITLIGGFAFNYTAFNAIIPLVNSSSSNIESGLTAILAFSLGYFPRLAIRWFNQVAYTALGSKQRQAATLPLSLIDGISQFHESRLRAEGIDNLQNLASANIEELLLTTRFNAQQLVEWVDQAILYLYVGPSNIDSFRRGGVRGISDFQGFWGRYCIEGDNDAEGSKKARQYQEKFSEAEDPEGIRKNRALQFQSTPEYLDALYATTLEGPNMAYIQNYWSNLNKYVEKQQESVVHGEEYDQTIINTKIEIFKEISTCNLLDDSLDKLGRIAHTLDNEIKIDDIKKLLEESNDKDKTDVSLGLVRWLWWLTNDGNIDGNYANEARRHYNNTIGEGHSDSEIKILEFYYEFKRALFHASTGEQEKAERHKKMAQEFAEQLSKGGLELKILSQVMLAIISYTFEEENDEGQKLQKAAQESIKNAVQDAEFEFKHVISLGSLLPKSLERFLETLKNDKKVLTEDLEKALEDLQEVLQNEFEKKFQINDEKANPAKEEADSK